MKNKYSRFPIVLSLLLFIVVIAITTFIPHLSFAYTQAAMTKNACESFKKADRELNRVYQSILKDKAYASDALFIKKFKAAQRAWIAFRDAELAALYPHDQEPMYYGSVYPMCDCMQAEALTRDRIKELKTWEKGIEEGNVCAGSVKNKRE